MVDSGRRLFEASQGDRILMPNAARLSIGNRARCLRFEQNLVARHAPRQLHADQKPPNTCCANVLNTGSPWVSNRLRKKKEVLSRKHVTTQCLRICGLL